MCIRDSPIGRLPIDLVEGADARTEILDQRPPERLAVHLDFAQREARFDRLTVRYPQSAFAQSGELFLSLIHI